MLQIIFSLIAASPAGNYEIMKLPDSLGGTVTRGTAINDHGWVAGFSGLPPNNSTRHAVVWRNRAITDLGTLGGPNSSVVWPGINNRGMIVGITETAELDPLGESWSCSAFFPSVTGHTCVGFFWEGGVMTPMPALGGNNSYAAGVNQHAEVVGWAETALHDPTCNAPQVLQFHAVLWEPRRNRHHALLPLAGDSSSAATAINDRGQAVGISGDCDVAVGRFSARHAVLWEQGTVTELPNLGGTSWHTPVAINDAGDVAGFSNPPDNGDGTFLAHAFFWSAPGGITDLGVLPGHDTSQATGMNNRGQVVGVSCGASGCRAFLWENNVLSDLNDRIPGLAPDVLISAQDINQAGKITGRIFEASSGRTMAFIAAPAR